MVSVIKTQSEFDKLNEEDKWHYIEEQLRNGAGYEVNISNDKYLFILHQQFYNDLILSYRRKDDE